MLFLFLLSLSVAEVFSIRCYITNARDPWDSPTLLDCLDSRVEQLTGYPVPPEVESNCYEVDVDGGEMVIKGCLARGFCPLLEDRLNSEFRKDVKCSECPSDGCNRNIQIYAYSSSRSEVGGRFLGAVLVLAALVFWF